MAATVGTNEISAPANGSASPATATGALPQLVRFADLLGELRDDAEDAFNARVKGIARGPVTGIASLDKVLGGVLQPGLHVVQGGTGVGKTGLMMQIATDCGAPALVISTEMRLLELLKRHTARVTDTFLDRLKSGELAPDDAVKLAMRAAQAAPHVALVDATRTYVEPALIQAFADAIRHNAGTKHVLVIVDSVHTWAESAPIGLGESATEYDRLNAALAALRGIASRLNCPVIGTAERNRASAEKGGVGSSAGTRRFEYSAETVIGITVEEGKDAPMLPFPQKPVRIVVEKNRNGGAGMSLKATFNGALQKFTDREA